MRCAGAFYGAGRHFVGDALPAAGRAQSRAGPRRPQTARLAVAAWSFDHPRQDCRGVFRHDAWIAAARAETENRPFGGRDACRDRRPPLAPALLLRKPATSATKNKRLATWRKSRKALVRKVAQLALAKTGGAGASTAARAGGSTRGDTTGDANLRGQL